MTTSKISHAADDTKNTMPEKESEESLKKRLGLLILRQLRKEFQSEARRHEFEEWYLKNYGKPYVWKMKGDETTS